MSYSNRTNRTSNSGKFQEQSVQRTVRIHETPASARSKKKAAGLQSASRESSRSVSVSDVPDNVTLPTEPEGDDDDVDFAGLDEIVMAVDMHNKDTIGCAYYVAEEETLYVLVDIKYGGIDVVDKLQRYTQPTVTLISSRVDEKVEEYLRSGADPDDGSNTSFPPFILDIRPSHEFGYDSALRKLIDVDLELFREATSTFVVPGDDDPATNYKRGLEPGLSYAQGNIVQLSSAIDLESRLSVSCAGAVLSYLQRRRAIVHFPGDPDAAETFKITYLETFGLETVMSVNTEALISMQILQADYHPHIHNQGPTNTASGSKEGLSVFGLFQPLARTPQGKHLLRQYFLRPSLDLQILANRHASIGVLLHPENEVMLQNLVKSLKNITNMKNTVQSLKRGINDGISKGGGMKSSVWFRLRSFAYYALMIEQDVRSLAYARDLDIRNKVLEGFDRQSLGSVGRTIIEVIDFAESQIAHRTVVLRGVDDQLDEMKRQYNGLEDMLNHVSKEIAKTVPEEFVTGLNVVFFPQIGFLIAMPVNPVTEAVDYRDPVWEQSFYTAERTYFKDFRMIELDNTIGDIYADICDREIEIVHGLAQRILEHGDKLIRASDICAELDCLAALAQGAKRYNLTQPIMTEDNVLHVHDGWHILQTLIVPSYVANSLELQGGSGDIDTQDGVADNIVKHRSSSKTSSVLLLTGPNYSGKSVFLKQNAIIVYLAHVGSFVPATAATVGITDQILTRITTRETVSKMQSAFLLDLQQVSSALYTMTRRSLLVIDEFGKGTNTAGKKNLILHQTIADVLDGAGLFAGLTMYLLELGNNRPKVLGATHFHEIFEGGYITKHPNLGFAHMEVRLNDDAVEIEEQVTYLYNILPGRSTSTFGTICALANGIEESVVARAEHLLLEQARGVDLTNICAGTDDQKIDEVKKAEDVAREFLMLEMEAADLNRNSEDLQHWLDRVLKAEPEDYQTPDRDSLSLVSEYFD